MINALERSLRDEKNLFRRNVFNSIKLFSKSEIEREGISVLSKIQKLGIMKGVRTCCIYLPIVNEFNTMPLIKYYLEEGVKFYLPTVTGSDSQNMDFYLLESYNIIESLKTNKWGIKELSEDSKRLNITEENIDIVFVPGVAYDKQRNRLGRGRGYYGIPLKYF